MTYQNRVEDMIGKQMAEFQLALSVAEKAKELVSKAPDLPNGYPETVYHPGYARHFSREAHFYKSSEERLSNGVPSALKTYIFKSYPLGVYCEK